jgi:alpha-L-fucosidase 2
VTGLRARGGFEVSITWANGVPDVVAITSLHGGTARLRFGPTVRELATAAGQTYMFRGARLAPPG